MKRAPFMVLALAVGGAATLTTCKKQQPARVEQVNFSYVSDPSGPRPVPTHQTSIYWIALEGPPRFATVQELIKNAGQHCPTVIRAVLKGAGEGIDEWRVTCSDSREWAIWLKPQGPPEVLQCSPAYCS